MYLQLIDNVANLSWWSA